MGFGLDTESCAMTGKKEGLYWISPKSGRCVIKEVGLPYKDKLFKLPNLLKQRYTENNLANLLQLKPSKLERVEAHRVLGYFIDKHFSDIPKIHHLLELREKIILRLYHA
jgi:recombinational DNA repair protein (RecF pathway)